MSEKTNLKKLIINHLPNFDITMLRSIEFTSYIDVFTVPSNLEMLCFKKRCGILICPEINKLRSIDGEIKNMPSKLDNLTHLYHGDTTRNCKTPNLKSINYDGSKIRLHPAKILITVYYDNINYKRSKNITEGSFESIKDISYNLRLGGDGNKYINCITDLNLHY
jgi:hypothetical protein